MLCYRNIAYNIGNALRCPSDPGAFYFTKVSLCQTNLLKPSGLHIYSEYTTKQLARFLEYERCVIELRLK